MLATCRVERPGHPPWRSRPPREPVTGFELVLAGRGSDPIGSIACGSSGDASSLLAPDVSFWTRPRRPGRLLAPGQLDEDRLLPGKDKRERDLMKKLDKLAAQSGWYTFVSAQAHAIATGKAPARRNAEIMVAQEVMRWRGEVERFAPDRLDEFDAGIQHALEHPAPLQRPEGR